MCTALHAHGCFGRTLDLEYTYAEQVVMTPRDFSLALRHLPPLTRHYAILGMATVADGYPLYYDAVNEQGLAMAGLHFPHSGRYAPVTDGAKNVASFELIPYILGQCADIQGARQVLQEIRVCDTAFSADFPPTRLHWMVADGTGALVVESTADRLAVYDNLIGVMTNEPPFPFQLARWKEFARLTPYEPDPTPPQWGRGSGSLGLPGDFTSPSRLARAAFVAAHSEAEENPVGQFFHAMATVEVPRGGLRLPDGRRVVSQYTSCMDLEQKVYYYRTYGCQRIHGVRLTEVEGNTLAAYPLAKGEEVKWEN
ncbi:MAG: linear amide C-N hydrolase [Clostridia bacterium]|nr:linear amide C-N hydrolase [Clostridia bacterium]